VVNRPPGRSHHRRGVQILFQIGTGKSLAQLRARAAHRRRSLSVIKRLQMTGLIEPLVNADDDTAPDEAGYLPASPSQRRRLDPQSRNC